MQLELGKCHCEGVFAGIKGEKELRILGSETAASKDWKVGETYLFICFCICFCIFINLYLFLYIYKFVFVAVCIFVYLRPYCSS